MWEWWDSGIGFPASYECPLSESVQDQSGWNSEQRSLEGGVFKVPSNANHSVIQWEEQCNIKIIYLFIYLHAS